MSLPKTATMEDMDLLGMFQEGGARRAEAFEYIYRNWKERACRILKSKGVQDADVQDIVHKAFIIFDRKMRNEDFELTGGLENFFIKICVNQAIVFFNKNKRVDLTDDEKKLYPKDVQESVIPFFSEDCKSLIRMLFKTLDPKCREVLLYYKQGYDRETIATTIITVLFRWPIFQRNYYRNGLC